MIESVFRDSNANDWIECLPKYQKDLIFNLYESGKSPEEVAVSWLSRAGSVATFPFGGQSGPENFYDAIKIEFNKLVCGNKEYDDVREKLVAQGGLAKNVIIATISTAIAVKIGIAAATIGPVIAILLSLVVQISKNAWCSMHTV